MDPTLLRAIAGLVLAACPFALVGAAEVPESTGRHSAQKVCGAPDDNLQAVRCPLILEISKGSVETLRKRIADGEDPDCHECHQRIEDGSVVTSWGWTPLMAAAHAGDLPKVRLLVESGADIHAETSLHQNALTFAQETRHLEVADFLRNLGAVVPDGFTPVPDRPHGVKRID